MTPQDGPGGHDPTVVAGLGSEFRHDDAVGVVVSRQVAQELGVRDVGPAVDPLDLLGRWDGARLAVVIDALRSGAHPGTVRVVDLGAHPERDPVPRVGVGGEVRRAPVDCRARRTSSHGVDVIGVLRLARAVGRAPDRVVLVGVEGEDFTPGLGLSPCVAEAVPTAVAEVLSLVRGVAPCA